MIYVVENLTHEVILQLALKQVNRFQWLHCKRSYANGEALNSKDKKSSKCDILINTMVVTKLKKGNKQTNSKLMVDIEGGNVINY